MFIDAITKNLHKEGGTTHSAVIPNSLLINNGGGSMSDHQHQQQQHPNSLNVMGNKINWNGIQFSKDLSNEQRRDLRNALTKIKVPETTDSDIRKNIQKMDIQDVNRNTRFFKDYIKD